MPLLSSETRSTPPTPHDLDDGPVLECAPPPQAPTHRGDAADQPLRIRARRVYPVSREELFATWTTRTAWDSWMRLRARSRSTLAPYRGGAFRLELADGPAIHVITGTLTEVRPLESLSFTWIHQNANDHGSTLDIAFRDHREESELTLLHRSISNRREAAWLMGLWAVVLDRLGAFLADGTPSPRRVPGIGQRMPQAIKPERRRVHARGTFARSAGIAFALLSLSAYTSVTAQVATDSAQAAAAYFFAGKWSDAARAYGSLARNDTSAVTWYRYGVALDEIGRYDDAVVALRRAVRTEGRNAIHEPGTLSTRESARRARRTRQRHRAARQLRGRWIPAMGNRSRRLRLRFRFAATRGSHACSARLETNRFPCRSTPEHRQLDYWVGDWRVMSGNVPARHEQGGARERRLHGAGELDVRRRGRRREELELLRPLDQKVEAAVHLRRRRRLGLHR